MPFLCANWLYQLPEPQPCLVAQGFFKHILGMAFGLWATRPISRALLCPVCLPTPLPPPLGEGLFSMPWGQYPSTSVGFFHRVPVPQRPLHMSPGFPTLCWIICSPLRSLPAHHLLCDLLACACFCLFSIPRPLFQRRFHLPGK